jgi:hypothetical protein
MRGRREQKRQDIKAAEYEATGHESRRTRSSRA